MLMQDDIGIMIEGTDGQYLQAGAILLPGFWRLEDKAGLPLDAIHKSGHVPSVAHALPSAPFPSSPVQRNNWFIQFLTIC
ncbi:hypothetical protein F5888DRAFT_1712643 [Russula emetica]|nr:hypothetical protein F5888DRAFT_1712643 [Russula emetica]